MYQDSKPVTNGSLRESLEKFEKRIEQKTTNVVAQGLVLGIQALSARENQRPSLNRTGSFSPPAIEGSRRGKYVEPIEADEEQTNLLDCIQKLADSGPDNLLDIGAKMFHKPKNHKNKFNKNSRNRY